MIYHISYIRLPIIFWYFYKNCKPCGLQIYSNFCRLSYHPNCLPTQWKHFLQSRFQGAHRCSWDVEIYIDDSLVGQLTSFQGVQLTNGGFKELRNIFITWHKHLRLSSFILTYISKYALHINIWTHLFAIFWTRSQRPSGRAKFRRFWADNTGDQRAF